MRAHRTRFLAPGVIALALASPLAGDALPAREAVRPSSDPADKELVISVAVTRNDETREEIYRTPHNRFIAAIGDHPEAWVEKFLGIEGTVVAVTKGPRGKPQLRIRARNFEGDARDISIGSLVIPDWELKVGQFLKVTGFFFRVPELPEGVEPPEHSAPAGEYLLLAQCLYDPHSKLEAALAEGATQCELWREGVPPEQLTEAANSLLRR